MNYFLSKDITCVRANVAITAITLFAHLFFSAQSSISSLSIRKVEQDPDSSPGANLPR